MGRLDLFKRSLKPMPEQSEDELEEMDTSYIPEGQEEQVRAAYKNMRRTTVTLFQFNHYAFTMPLLVMLNWVMWVLLIDDRQSAQGFFADVLRIPYALIASIPSTLIFVWLTKTKRASYKQFRIFLIVECLTLPPVLLLLLA